uniref:Uncharacterized protein n=1 Tax=Arundo donax TaxID=35708 RepID=A0A0A9F181_ARUDO
MQQIFTILSARSVTCDSKSFSFSGL